MGCCGRKGIGRKSGFEILHSAAEVGGSWEDPEDAISGEDPTVLGAQIRGGRRG